jgi:hypothetical protein
VYVLGVVDVAKERTRLTKQRDQRRGQDFKAGGGLPYVSTGRRQEEEQTQRTNERPGGAISVESLAHFPKPGAGLALDEHGPAAQDRTEFP